MYTRQNQKNMTSAQRAKFVRAVLKLKSKGIYDDFVRIHGQYYVSDGDTGLRVGHMTPSFFPWHRRLILEFERKLQSVDSSVTLPYWDWTRDNAKTSSIWASDFLGGDGRQSDGQVMTGPFAYVNGNWPITVGVTDEKYLTRQFGRPDRPIGLPTKADLDKATAESVYDTSPWNSTSTTKGFRNKIEGWTVSETQGGFLHNRVHQWVGGHMTGATSPNDPVFWLHHAFIDLIWLRWQRKYPKAGYLPARPLAASDPQHGRVVSLNEPMPPWNTKPSEVMNLQNIYRYEEN